MPTKMPIYMDHHATTPVDPRVVEAMLPYFTEIFGNAASIDHLHGHAAQEAVEKSRASIAKFINAREPEEIVFTSGATESDNIALIGIAEAYGHRGNHIITSAIEHKAVLDSLEYLVRRGLKATILPVDRYGMVDPDDVERAITNETILISIMTANNEIGTIQPVEQIGRISRQHGVMFHTDAAQAVGHIPVDVQAMGIDLMSFTAHKIYGPKGIGALYARRRRPRVRPAPVIHGGGHERGIRSGTLNVPGIIGFEAALAIANQEMDETGFRLRRYVEAMLGAFYQQIDGVELNGHPTDRLPHNLNIYVPNIEAQALVLELSNEIALSTGAACATAVVEPSHVISALGFGDHRPFGSVRFGVGRFNDICDIQSATQSFVSAVNRTKQRFQLS